MRISDWSSDVCSSDLLRMIAPASCVALYIPMGSEAPADGYAGMLIESGKQLCLPCLEGNDPGMIFRRWSPADSLAPGHASVGTPLPAAPAMVPAPLIAQLLARIARFSCMERQCYN